MHSTAIIASFLASLALSNAIKVESPNKDTVWQSNSPQTVEWTAVDTDPRNFSIQLVNQAGYLDGNSPVTLIDSQSTGDSGTTQSATVTYPGGSWPTGIAFQINLISTDSHNTGILAQSEQFNITSGGDSSSSASSSSSSSASSSSSSAASSASSSSTSATVVRTTAASSASAATSAATSGSSASASGSNSTLPNTSSGASLTASAGIASVVLAVAGVLALA
ncbi:hypothetical protein C343_04572 [Cryptococcus neoformans C23]|uniref:Yeast cell wall synthesis Kre9/Knh1-like N-terminal domain-containing protein n=2 Tax=Cryptococcus neoformans TaxID=5207 RepID=A0A854QHC3_CRYNE|nr:hypothetical protein CNAG_03223 [Cryptococcus neoformans var. grubii H99]AUB26368.1 hypothetical protein CKF44_03223 [Cryptococcus neoformans var. grubii]OWZ30333.1 hypothetical protein C347_04619 [Cryptococcus neoformans var. grubii AD2-60a]OWZ38296.1 hypothetical protein C353_04472 [Cryptococcus neoformans var. grubii AD1-83a]OWZ42052.1 hypothetical protein C343_04572 [Cryptococcus neoformans var. grubii C23]OWZ53076.1 hypothetical protein C368_04645 [Cryptococcus neoformans var. grubii 1|eukprot:XP_012051107.1 hypothetical protein CNAG_03223 [Cryptococcus neoformans var. grubii H99]